VRAFEEGKRFADEFHNAHTTASGLRVPKAIGDFLIIDALRASGGTAIAVTDKELIAATKEIGAAEGIFCAPEGAACLPALRKLFADGSVQADERVVMFNTGSGLMCGRPRLSERRLVFKAKSSAISNRLDGLGRNAQRTCGAGGSIKPRA
jgi:threonine synthase